MIHGPGAPAATAARACGGRSGGPAPRDAGRSGDPIATDAERVLQDLYLLATLVDITWTLLTQAGQALRDTDLLDVVRRCDQETAVQAQWLRTRVKQAAPQALIAAS